MGVKGGRGKKDKFASRQDMMTGWDRSNLQTCKQPGMRDPAEQEEGFTVIGWDHTGVFDPDTPEKLTKHSVGF